MEIKISVLTLLFIISFAGCSKSETLAGDKVIKTFTNPVWDGADPWMVKHGDDYIYCYSVKNSIVLSKSQKMTQKGELKNI